MHDHGGPINLDEPGLSIDPADIRGIDDITGAGDVFVAIREVDIAPRPSSGWQPSNSRESSIQARTYPHPPGSAAMCSSDRSAR